MTQPVLDLYGAISSQISVLIRQYPRTAVFEFQIGGRAISLTFTELQPVEQLTKVLDDCYEIRIYDRNVLEQNQLEFGRFRVELWDEDNVIGEFTADSFLQQ